MEKREKSSTVFGVMAEFADEQALLAAARQVKASGYNQFDAFSPFPIHGMGEAIGFTKTKVPLVTLIGGIAGFCFGYGLEFFVSTMAYPLNIGGRPTHSIPAFIPPAYETTILFASFSAALGMLIMNGFPQPNHPVFNVERFRQRASNDGFFLCIEATDPKFALADTTQFLKSLNAKGIYEVEE